MEISGSLEKYKGPYDLYEQLMAEAREADNRLRHMLVEDEEAGNIRAYLLELEAELQGPFIGREVSIRGEAAQPVDVDDDGIPVPVLTGEVAVVEGIYKGIYVFPFYHRDEDGDYYITNRVVHRIEHPPHISADYLGGRNEYTPSTYIAVTGSHMETDSVTDSHSFKYLEGSTNWLAGAAAETIDIIALSDALPSEKVSRLLQYLDTNLADIVRDPELRRNVFSYVNSLGLFNNIELLGQVFLYTADNGSTAARFTRSDSYRMRGINGITIKNKLILGDDTAHLSDTEFSVYFALTDPEFGQTLIPTEDRLTLIFDGEEL